MTRFYSYIIRDVGLGVDKMGMNLINSSLSKVHGRGEIC